MRVILASLLAGLLFLSMSHAQTGGRIRAPHAPGDPWDVSEVTVRSVRRVAKSAVLGGGPGVEVELFSPHALYVGGLEWFLRAGAAAAHGPARRRREGGETLTYTFSMKDWKKLRSGDPLVLSWGGRDAAPFAHVSKKMLRKK